MAFEQQLLQTSLQIPHYEEKAMAYVIVRELLEDLHSEGNIPENEMEEINKKAVTV